MDEFGKRHQKYGGPTRTQASEERNTERERIRKAKEAIANGQPIPTGDTFATLTDRYIAFQRKRCAAGELSKKELERQEGIIRQH